MSHEVEATDSLLAELANTKIDLTSARMALEQAKRQIESLQVTLREAIDERNALEAELKAARAVASEARSAIRRGMLTIALREAVDDHLQKVLSIAENPIADSREE